MDFSFFVSVSSTFLLDLLEITFSLSGGKKLPKPGSCWEGMREQPGSLLEARGEGQKDSQEERMDTAAGTDRQPGAAPKDSMDTAAGTDRQPEQPEQLLGTGWTLHLEQRDRRTARRRGWTLQLGQTDSQEQLPRTAWTLQLGQKDSQDSQNSSWGQDGPCIWSRGTEGQPGQPEQLLGTGSTLHLEQRDRRTARTARTAPEDRMDTASGAEGQKDSQDSQDHLPRTGQTVLGCTSLQELSSSPWH
ncbi:uncharacterized protein LOC131092178 [Melospiza georgiana]|uniref:uncharacterized protein LOC131092178 n=1 Tax=Melospiza georgiana TaxID=44398 RepID=UPI0025AC459C|nr:uncharacterized protein LOC131092178 [Melospiza georgiana]